MAYTKKQKKKDREQEEEAEQDKEKQNVNKQAGKYEQLWRGTKIAKQIAKGKNFSSGIAMQHPHYLHRPHPTSSYNCDILPCCPRLYINICAYLAKRPLHAT